MTHAKNIAEQMEKGEIYVIRKRHQVRCRSLYVGSYMVLRNDYINDVYRLLARIDELERNASE